MRRIDPEIWSGVFVSLICLAVGAPVLVLNLSGTDVTVGPPWLWWLAYLGFVVTLLVSIWLQGVLGRRSVLGFFSAQVVFSVATVLLAPRLGWTPIILVFTAALSCYLVPRAVTVAIIAGNTAVVVVSVGAQDGQPFEILMSGLLYLLLQLGTVLAVAAQQRDVAARRELAVANIELRAATALLAESSRSDERLRIARELHDLIGHQLTALTLELEVATHHSSPPAKDHVLRARRIARDLLDDVRSTVGELRGRANDLRTALERVVGGVFHPAVSLVVEDGVSVDEQSTTALVRCVQEVITNTIRHASANNLWIEITVNEGGGLRLHAVDDGQGAPHVSPGNGLRGIQERITALGGTVSFTGDRGFRVTAEVPQQ